jgi:hypothetical protein
MDIGFYLLDVVANNEKQEAIISSINKFCESRPYDNVVLFNNQFAKIDVNKKYYTLHIQQAKYFDGILFVFDTKSAMLTQTFPSPKKQILYISGPEWSANPSLPYAFWENIYMNNNLEIITDNKDAYSLCDICWKQPLHLLESINDKELINVINKI